MNKKFITYIIITYLIIVHPAVSVSNSIKINDEGKSLNNGQQYDKDDRHRAKKNALCDDLFLGKLYEEESNYVEAKKYYIKAFKCKKDADREEAIKSFKRLVKANMSCDDLFLGKLYEEESNYVEAKKYYIKAFKCKKDADREEAIKSFKKLNTVKSKFRDGSLSNIENKIKNFFSLFSNILYYVVLLAFAFLLSKLFFKSINKKNNVVIKIDPFEILPSEKGKNFNFENYLLIILDRLKYQSKLRGKISKFQSQSVYPSIRTDSIDAFLGDATKIINPNYRPIISKIYSFINPPSYNINGHILFHDLNKLQYVVCLRSNEGKCSYWDNVSTISTLGEDMKNIAHKILITIK